MSEARLAWFPGETMWKLLLSSDEEPEPVPPTKKARQSTGLTPGCTEALAAVPVKNADDIANKSCPQLAWVSKVQACFS